jgi:hypothetical protein
MKRFSFRCEEWTKVHVRFSLFDPVGANCGVITLRVEDVLDFISKTNWNGGINWNGRIPEEGLPV